MDNQPNRPDDVNPPEEPSLSFADWLKANAITLIVLAIVGVLLVKTFDAEGIWSVAKAAVGLGFIIFIHELGHFLVAKWCDVHVTTFSIGFGPALPGCSFQWGETTYKLALVPLGGYVQMVGQVDGSEEADETDTDPRSYRNKTVGQRMAIISAGVVMNIILAFLCFSLVFQVHGKDRFAGVAAGTDAGAPAWVKGVPTGAVLLQIGNVKDPYFDDLRNIVVASYEGEQVPLVYIKPGDKEPTTIAIEPRRDREDKRPGGVPMIGIGYPLLARLESQRFLRKEFDHPVWFHTAAERANPPFEFGDDIVATSDPADPAQLKPLPEDPRQPGSGRRDYFELQRRMQSLAGKEMAFQVQRDDERVTITVPPAFHVTLGVRMQMGHITAVRERGPGWGKVQPFEPGGTAKGDIIEKVEVKDAQGKVVAFAGETLDPLRLPDQLRAWADTIKDDAKQVTLYVTRFNAPGAGNPPKREEVERHKPIALAWDDSWRFDKEWTGGITSPLAVPELGIAYRVQTTVAGYEPNRPADAPTGGLQPGDVIKRVKLHQLDPTAKGEDGRPTEKNPDSLRWDSLEGDQWAYVFQSLQSLTLKKLTLEVERDGKTVVLADIAGKEDPTWPLTDRGLILAKDLRLQKAANLGEAIGLGLKDTWGHILQVYSHLRNLLSGRIAVTNLAGPLGIAEAAYRFAGFDVWEFIFFLGMISVNLAVVNFLPIPVLDGGHMVFLLYEKLRGKPASEGVRVGATYVGLLMLVSLMLFVIGLDIFRKLGWLG